MTLYPCAIEQNQNRPRAMCCPARDTTLAALRDVTAATPPDRLHAARPWSAWIALPPFVALYLSSHACEGPVEVAAPGYVASIEVEVTCIRMLLVFGGSRRDAK